MRWLGGFARIAGLFAVAVAAALSGGNGAGAGGDPAIVGQWSAPIDWPVTGIHAAVLRTGEVITFAYPFEGQGSEAWVAGVAATHFTMREVPVSRDLFCAGHAFLPDGSLLVLGGNDARSMDPFFYGTADVHRFDPDLRTWMRLDDMAEGRWYPTATALEDGRILISSGLNQQSKVTSEFEIFDPKTGQTRRLKGADRYPDLYPWMFLLPSGEVVHAGPEDVSMLLDVGAGEWSEVAGNDFGYRQAGTAALLPLHPPGYRPVVMAIGGGDPATERVELLDMGTPEPGWEDAEAMHHARRHANSTLLPDGTVLVTGGTTTKNERDLAIKPAELYDPEADTWTETAPLVEPRIYHSTAVLLADGRVMTSGGDDELTAEVFSPPYLFRGERPEIVSAPGGAVYGGTFDVEVQGEASEVVLVRPSSVTHSFNQEQRLIELEFEKEDGSLSVETPPGPTIAPPGYYMLFVLNAEGVPSVLRFIRLGETTDGSLRGDTDCDGDVDVTDGLALLRHSAGLSGAQGAPCPEIGIGEPAFGDMDCDGDVDEVDSLVVLRYVAGLLQVWIPECPPPGQ